MSTRRLRVADFAPVLLLPLLLPLPLAGCGDGSRSGGAPAPATTAAPLGSATPGTTSAVTAPGWPLTLAFRAEVARAFAPQLRFNAYHDDGNASRQNRSEDFFPMGVASFFRELAQGQARVLVQGSSRDTAGASELRPTGQVRFGGQAVEGFPRGMVGDAPGSAPLYVHVYEDLSGRLLQPDGSGELIVHVEYWVFYAYDRADMVFFGFVRTSGSADVIGHRGDWEHITVRARVQTGPGGAFLGGVLDESTYYGHGGGFRVPAAEIERVDDQGQPDPTAQHPVVYVAGGKHASYPQAGHWEDPFLPGWVADFTDFFRGNGVRVDGWRVPLHDLEEPQADPAEFSSPEFQQAVLASPYWTPALLPDWTEFPGKWGPDLSLHLASLNLTIGLSPTAPTAKAKYGDFGGRGQYDWWSDVKARERKLVVYADQGIVVPDVSPPPVPVRR